MPFGEGGNHSICPLEAGPAACCLKGKVRPPRARAVAMSGPASADPVEELLRAPFHVEAGILLGLVAGKPRDALDEVEDALCRA